jgi:hypothetical protein
MKKHVAAGVAMAVTATTGLAPVAASAQTQAGSDAASQPAVPDLSTPAGVLDYLRTFGVTDAQIDEFAAQQGLDRQGFIEMVVARNAAGAARSGKVAPPSVEMVDGTFRYNNTVKDSMRFIRTASRNQVGRHVPGGCEFPEVTTGSGVAGTHAVSEVTAFDPESCTRVVFDGVYDPAAQRNVPSSSRGFPDCDNGSGPETGPPTIYNPGIGWVQGEYRRYYKHSFVDPVCITITSGSLNVRWKNNGSSNITRLTGSQIQRFYYTELSENWPSNWKFWNTSAGGGSWTAPTYTEYFDHQRTETDFPEHLALVAAAAGVAAVLVTGAACSWDFSDTTFTSEQTKILRRNGAWNATGGDSVVGGCSSLVHTRAWHGSGYAR